MFGAIIWKTSFLTWTFKPPLRHSIPRLPAKAGGTRWRNEKENCMNDTVAAEDKPLADRVRAATQGLMDAIDIKFRDEANFGKAFLNLLRKDRAQVVKECFSSPAIESV
jgi:hypothetical protein